MAGWYPLESAERIGVVWLRECRLEKDAHSSEADGGGKAWSNPGEGVRAPEAVTATVIGASDRLGEDCIATAGLSRNRSFQRR